MLEHVIGHRPQNDLGSQSGRRDGGLPIRRRLKRRTRVCTVAVLIGGLAALPPPDAGADGGLIPDPLPPGTGLVELGGIANTRIFDPATNRWTSRPDMHFARWYPTAVMLPGGRVLVGTGVRRSQRNDQGTNQRLTETFNPSTNTWTVNNTGLLSQKGLPLYARMWLMPNGKVFYDGTGQAWAPGGGGVEQASWGLRSFFNLRTKQWEPPTNVGTMRSVPGDVMLRMAPPYTRSSLLIAGGVLGPSPDTLVATPLSEKVTVDRAGKVTSQITGPLNRARWANPAVVLPTGQVVTFNGADKEETFVPGQEKAIRRAEIFNPRTNRWRRVAFSHRDRTYHNTAILLPDARVLVGGHAPAPNGLLYHHDSPLTALANNERDPSFEIYSPPYLFRGTRPRIRHVRSGIAWDSTFRVRVRCGAAHPRCRNGRMIREVVLSRLPAQTHTTDVNQRSMTLSFTRKPGTNVLRVKAPPNGVTAPPGPYYLFVNRRSDRGKIPSVARIVTIGEHNKFTRAARPFRPGAGIADGSATPTQDTRTRPPAQCEGYECDPPPTVHDEADPVYHRTLAQKRSGGEFSAPIEEGGRGTPRCHRGSAPGQDGDYIICKPAGQTVITLKDGRVLYWDGFPGTENSKVFLRDGGNTTHNAFSRLLDLRGRTAHWARPRPQDGVGVNADIARGLAPDDAADNDADLFCSFQVHLAGGRILVVGGTDFYSDLLQTDVDGGLLG